MGTIKVHKTGVTEVKEVTLEEAQKLLEDAYNDPIGGIVADAITGEVIWRIAPEVKEIIIVQMLGGG